MHTQCRSLDRQPVNVSLVVTDYLSLKVTAPWRADSMNLILMLSQRKEIFFRGDWDFRNLLDGERTLYAPIWKLHISSVIAYACVKTYSVIFFEFQISQLHLLLKCPMIYWSLNVYEEVSQKRFFFNSILDDATR